MIAQTDAAEIQIQDVGAIENATIPIKRGTIVKLVGENGAGKSTAITAVTSAITKDNAGLRPRDGRMSGKIRMPGVTVTIGARMSQKKSGDLEPVAFAIVEDGTGISKILSPGVKDPIAADKRRLEGVLDVIGAELSESQMQEYLGTMYEEFMRVRDVKGKGFVEAVTQMKLFLDSKAREVKLQITSNEGAITEIGVIADPVEIPVAVEELARQVEAVSAALRDAKRDRERADQALEIINQPSATDVEAKQAELQAVETILAQHRAEEESLQKKIAELQGRLAQVQSDCRETLAKIDPLKEVIRVAKDSAERTERLRAQVAEAPTVEAIEKQTAELEELRKKHSDAIVAKSNNDGIETRKARLDELNKLREAAQKQHDALKTLSHGTAKILVDALKVVPGWTVNEDLRLCVTHRRGEIPFSELSPGEGTARVCLLACQFAEYGENEVPIVGLPQHCFEGLDGKNRRLLLDTIKEHGLCVVTAEADRNEETANGIRVEVMQ
jgi:ABC-type dipeptide/oligopeptide/nickel transport system ATPase component